MRRRRVAIAATVLCAVTAGLLDVQPIGEQPLWNPQEWPRTLAAVPSLREQLRRARQDVEAAIRLVEEQGATGPDQAKAMVDQAVDTFGQLDILINNAGIAGGEAPLTDACVAQMQAVLDVNLTGVLLGLKHGAPRMRDGGSIINTASLAASVTMPEYTGYSISKSGVVRLTQQAALELGPRGIRVNAVCPGTTVTPMEPADSPECQICRYTTALGRPGEAREQAAVYHFLASDESSYISGQAINVDGGWLHGVTPALGELVLARNTEEA